jgi:hypothetical protein
MQEGFRGHAKKPHASVEVLDEKLERTTFARPRQ